MLMSDVRGVAQLATQATCAVTSIVEGVHQSVWSSMGFPAGSAPGKTRGITGSVYRTIHAVTRITGKSTDAVIAGLQTFHEPADSDPSGNSRKEAFLAVLNGVMGDRLAVDNSPFAGSMTLRYQGEALNQQSLQQMPGAANKLVLLIHGLCMSDMQQHALRNEHPVEHGETLASELGYEPIYVRYNSGLHVSQNGSELSAQLEQLVHCWPEAIEELSVVAYSMGGLIIRSALHQARQQGLNWPDRIRNIVFLGTPHHGAPLERIGNWLDVILDSTPYTKPFTALGQLRSAGITDLRYGNVLHEDWQGHNRFHRKPDDRQILPLPESVNCYAVAATKADKRSLLADRLIGDGIVPLHSALGQHDEAARMLAFAESSQRIAYGTSHLELLSSPGVSKQIVHWLAHENQNCSEA